MRTDTNTTTVAAVNQRGMTLVEIMIVLAIMASVMGIVAFAVIPNIARSKVKNAEIEAAKWAQQCDIYLATEGEYPDSLEQVAEYMSGASMDDPWGNAYRLETGDGCAKVCSSGKDGSNNTEDDVCAPKDCQ